MWFHIERRGSEVSIGYATTLRAPMASCAWTKRESMYRHGLGLGNDRVPIGFSTAVIATAVHGKVTA